MAATNSDYEGLGAGPIPSSLCNAELELGGSLGPLMNSGMITKHRIRIEGSDALWIDYVQLTDNYSGTTWTWGVNNSVGYCFSTDASDGNDPKCWNNTAYSSIEFTF